MTQFECLPFADEDLRMFIGYSAVPLWGGGVGYIATRDHKRFWKDHSASTPEELIAKLDAAGIDRSRLRLDKWEDSAHDHALNPVQMTEFIALLGGNPNSSSQPNNEHHATMTRLFLDTEWANDAVHELVSLALVSQDGQHRFYAERDPLPGVPSSFVREVVYPLLDRGHTALPNSEFCAALRVFLAQFKDPLVLADGALDFKMLSHALNGFGRTGLPPAPSWRPMLMTFGDVQMRIEDYFDSRPDVKARRHHARAPSG